MIVTLMGPDDIGGWVLTDGDGNSYPFIASHEDHMNAVLLGWERPAGIDDEEAIMNALDWLMEQNGEDFEAPGIVSEYFKKLYVEEV